MPMRCACVNTLTDEDRTALERFRPTDSTRKARLRIFGREHSRGAPLSFSIASSALAASSLIRESWTWFNSRSPGMAAAAFGPK